MAIIDQVQKVSDTVWELPVTYKDGMRLLITNLTLEDVQPRLKEIVDLLFQRVPAGVGSHGFLKLSRQEFCDVVEQGARWCVEHGYGWDDDLSLTEENGCISGADVGKI